MSELPRPDDAADALAIAIWAANTERVGVAPAGAAVMDRAAVAPIARGETALRAGRPRGARRGARRDPRRQAQRLVIGRVIASVEGMVGAVALDSLVIEVGGIGYRVFAAPAVLAVGDARAAGSSSTRTTSSARTSRRCTASGRPRSSGSSTCC